MIPQNGTVLEDFTFEELPTNTFRLDVEQNVISGQIDGLEAMMQAVYLILSIERYSSDLLSTNYGVELVDLIGMPLDFCEAEIPRKITEALMQDNRISAVEEFIFERRTGYIHARFTVRTIFGNIEHERRIAV